VQEDEKTFHTKRAKIINSAVTLAQINTQKAQKEAQTAVDLAKRKKKAAEDETAAKERKELAKATWYILSQTYIHVFNHLLFLN
jgi:hypothetical protein